MKAFGKKHLLSKCIFEVSGYVFGMVINNFEAQGMFTINCYASIYL